MTPDDANGVTWTRTAVLGCNHHRRAAAHRVDVVTP